MNHNILNKKIPSFLGLMIIVFGVFITTLLVKGGNVFNINASPSDQPKNIQITNISDTSFTVIFTTDESVTGTINLGSTPKTLDEIVLDDRDELSQKISKYKEHTITAKNLDPNKKYYFSINSGTKKIQNDNSAFEIKTGPSINIKPLFQIPITGSVLNPDGSPPKEGLVKITIDGAQPLSSYLKNNGNYTIPLSTLRNSNLNNYFPLNSNSNIIIEIISSNLASKIEVTANQISPVPPIILSKNYNFENNHQNSEVKSTKSASFKDLVFPTMSPLKR